MKRKEAYQEFKRLKHEAIEREKPLLDCLNNERKEKLNNCVLKVDYMALILTM